MMGALGMLISAGVRQLENFAGVMNFVIFPMFFASTALYPLWRMQEASEALYVACLVNPFTSAPALIRFALYGSFDPLSFAIVAGTLVVAFVAATLAFDPARSFFGQRRSAE